MTHRTTLAFSYSGHPSLHPFKYLRCNLSSDCSSVLLLSKLTLSSSTELPSSSMRTFPSSRFLSLMMMPDCYARFSTSVSAPSSSWTATRGCYSWAVEFGIQAHPSPQYPPCYHAFQVSDEQCSKPWLVGWYRGLNYPIIWGLKHNKPI